ncbi:MAG TPA: 1,2-phenylacetyl-CoA epoxidase subunit PaaC [Acetobacteraceae bacterium]|nr:1,2-phenylacetyl-CoA epoxidase subunit PaaC [Acetobacteraceae bacterium]
MPTTSIRVADTPLLREILGRADDALVLGHRLSQWTGHAPMLEEELALANIALDLIGQARALYALAGEIEGLGHSEDDYAYLRDSRDFRNLLLVEQPNGDFAITIVRQVLYAAFIDPWWRETARRSTDSRLAAIAAKAEKESAYHLRHAAEWLIRLGDGTDESHRRAAAALEQLWPFVGEMFAPLDPSLAGLCADPASLHAEWDATVNEVLDQATLARPAEGWMQNGGRAGRHSEQFGHMIAEMQHLARSHPGATW